MDYIQGKISEAWKWWKGLERVVDIALLIYETGHELGLYTDYFEFNKVHDKSELYYNHSAIDKALHKALHKAITEANHKALGKLLHEYIDEVVDR